MLRYRKDLHFSSTRYQVRMTVALLELDFCETFCWLKSTTQLKFAVLQIHDYELICSQSHLCLLNFIDSSVHVLSKVKNIAFYVVIWLAENWASWIEFPNQNTNRPEWGWAITVPLASSCILAQTVNLIVFLYFLHLPILYCTGWLVVLDVSATVVPSSCRYRSGC